MTPPLPRRARPAIASAFFAQGLVFISLTTRLPQLMGRLEIGTLGQSLVLLTIVLLAGVGSLLAERAAVRLSSRTTLRMALALVAVGVAAIVLAPTIPWLAPALVVYGLGLGGVDAASNMQAVAAETAAGRPMLPSFHAAWTLGGIVASVIAIATAEVPLAAITTVALVPLLAAAAPLLDREPRIDRADSSDTAVPWRAIAVVGLALVLFYMVDTAATTWGPTYLDRASAPASLVALATLPYLVASGLQRWAGDRLVARLGAPLLLRAGAVVAAVALGLVALAPSWEVAVAGFTLLGLGVGVVAPLSFSAAAAIAGGQDLDPATRRARVDAVIARFNQFNYLGALLGAVLTGVVGAADLRWGFAVPMVLVLGLIPLASRFRPTPRGQMS